MLPATAILNTFSLISISDRNLRQALHLNLFTSPQFNCNQHASQGQTILLLRRGALERDPDLKWMFWPLDMIQLDLQYWMSPDLWRFLFVPAFVRGNMQIKEAMLKILLSTNPSSTRLLPQNPSSSDLLPISISLAAFCRSLTEDWPLVPISAMNSLQLTETIRLRDELRQLCSSASVRITEILGMERALGSSDEVRQSLFPLINAFLPETQDRMHSIMSMTSDPQRMQLKIYYASIFVETTDELTFLPEDNVLGDWMVNFFYAFRNILPEIRSDSVQKAFQLALDREASVEGVCGMLDLFRQCGVRREFRLDIQAMIQTSFIPKLWASCPASIVEPVKFVSFAVRKNLFLFQTRGISGIPIAYPLTDFFTFERMAQTKMTVLFEYMQNGGFDIFEAQNIFIGPALMPLRSFLEDALQMFLSVQHWYIVLKADMTIIPSPFLQPKMFALLGELILRCRQVECKVPFKLPPTLLQLSLPELASKQLSSEDDLAALDSVASFVTEFFLEDRKSAFEPLCPEFLQVFDKIISVTGKKNPALGLLMAQREIESVYAKIVDGPVEPFKPDQLFIHDFSAKVRDIYRLQVSALASTFNKYFDAYSFKPEEYYELLFKNTLQ